MKVTFYSFDYIKYLLGFWTSFASASSLHFPCQALGKTETDCGLWSGFVCAVIVLAVPCAKPDPIFETLFVLTKRDSSLFDGGSDDDKLERERG